MLLFSGDGAPLLVGLAFYSFASLGTASTYFASSRLTDAWSSKSFGKVNKARTRVSYLLKDASSHHTKSPPQKKRLN
jgi:hypothetical protein